MAVRTAIEAGSAPRLLQAIVQYGLDAEALNALVLDEHGHRAIHWAAALGQPEVRLCDPGQVRDADADAGGGVGPQILELLIARGADTTVRNATLETPLHRGPWALPPASAQRTTALILGGGHGRHTTAVAWGDCFNRETFARVLYLLRECLPFYAANNLTPFTLAAVYVRRGRLEARPDRESDTRVRTAF